MGYYFFWEIKLPEEELIEFNNKLKLEEGLLRYLLVRKEGKDNPSALKKSKGGKNGPKITQ